MLVNFSSSAMVFQQGKDAPDCCQKRQLGLAVSCCEPLPKDQIIKPVTTQQWQWVEEAKNEKGIFSWFKALISGFLADIRYLFTKNIKAG